MQVEIPAPMHVANPAPTDTPKAVPKDNPPSIVQQYGIFVDTDKEYSN
jgi:hypothetical protein